MCIRDRLPEGGASETENPWCFFVDFRDRFVCYVDAAFQEVLPFFWATGSSYEHELGRRTVRLLCYGALSVGLLFFLRGMHEYFLAKMFREEESMDEEEVEQLEVDEEEYDEAIEDVVNDAAGNASGWLLSLSLIHISEPTRLLSISYAVFCLKKKKNKNKYINT
eukprot:TRINITY_DN26880_c0_g1_i2.p1 TRINITY_DN26880_c0_g1~~TRINITY_DN26880_c0_g1_i2.p1  ORF type:complete len:165 (-),score=54.32 TRINITY_DN26880_c0_g1_i2:60-554(-)